MSHIPVLKGSRKIEGIKLVCCEEVNMIDAAFEKKKNLEFSLYGTQAFHLGLFICRIN